MKNTHQKHQQGYTLIELLLYVAIVGSLLTGVVAFFGVVVDARVKNQSVTEVNEQGSFALDYVAQTIRNASSITSPTIGTTASALTVVVPTASLSPTIFSLSSGVLQVKEGTAAAVNLTGSKVQVTAFSVKNLSRASTPGLVQISLTLNRPTSSAGNSYDYPRTFTTSVAIRP